MAVIEIDVHSNATSRLPSLRSEFERTEKSINSTTQSVGVLNKGIVGLVGAIGGLYGVKSAFDSIQVGFKTLETASLEVSKTTGLVGDDLKKLTDELDNMSTTMGGFEVKGLYAIAESAGQLGIKGVDNLKQFTKEMQYMASSSKLTAEEASTGFAEIANALNLPIKDINKLTSSFSKLASTTTADEAKLLDFTQRLAGAGKTLGLTNAEIVAVGATMKDVGVNVEVGGTAMSQVFAKMLKDTEQFAKVSNMELSEYSKMIDDKPVKALETFLESLGKLDKRAKIQALDDMKLSGSGLSSTLLKLSTNTEKLTANIKTSSEAYIYGKATQDEYAVASESLANQQTKTESAILLLKKAIGDELKPMMISLNDTTVDAIKWTQENKGEIAETATQIAILSGSYLVITKSVKAYNAVLAIQTSLGVLSNLSSVDRAVLLVSKAYTTGTTAIKGMNIALNAMPLIAVAGAVAYLATELWDAKKASDAMRKSASLTIDELKKMDIARLNSNKVLIKSALRKNQIEIATASKELRVEREGWYGSGVFKGDKESIAIAEERLATLREEGRELQKQRGIIKEISIEKKALAKDNDFDKYTKAIDRQKTLNKLITDIASQKIGDSIVQQQIQQKKLKSLSDEFMKVDELITKDKERFKWYVSQKSEEKKATNGLVSETEKLNNEIDKLGKGSNGTSPTTSINKGIDETARLLKEFGSDYNRATMDRTTFQIHQLDIQKKEYLKNNMDRKKVDEWYVAETSKISNEAQKQVTESAKIEQAERDRIIKISMEEEERLAKEQSEKLKRFDDVLNRSTMDSFDYKIKKLDEEKAKYQEIGAEKVKIDAWYSSEFEKIENERISKIEADAKKVADDEQSRIDKQLEKEKKLADAKNEAHLKYLEITGQKEELEDIAFDRQIKYFEELGYSAEKIDELEDALLMKSIEGIEEKTEKVKKEISALQDLGNIAIGEAKNAGLDILSSYSQTGNIQGSFDEYAQSGQLSSTLMSSGNPYAMGLAMGGELLSGALTEPMSDFAQSEADIYAGITTLNDSMSVLNDLDYQHLDLAKSSTEYLRNIQDSLVGIGRTAVFDSSGFATGKSFTASHSYSTDSVESNTGIGMDNIHDFIATLDIGTLVTRLVGDIFNTGSNEFVDDVSASLVKSLMGDKEQSLADAGVKAVAQSYSQIMADGLQVLEYQVIETEKNYAFGLVSSTSSKDKFNEIEGGIETDINSIIVDMIGSSLEIGAKLGVSESQLGERIGGYVSEEMKQSFDGKSADEISEYFSGYFGNEANKMAELLLPNIKDFQLQGEELGTTFLRMGVQTEQATYGFERLGLMAIDFSDITSNMDLEFLNSDTSAYISGFKTDAEQLDIALGDLDSIFGAVNLATPHTVEEMNNLVDGLDRSNPKWIEQYDTIMRNAGAVTSYIDAVDAQAEAEKQRLDDIAEAESKATKEAEDFAKTLERLGDVVASATLETKTYIDKRGMDTLQGIEYDKDKIVDSLGLDFIEEINVDNFDVVIDSWREAHATKVAITEAEEASVKALSSILIAEDKEIRNIEEQRAKDAVTRAEETAEKIKEIELFYQSDRLDSYKEFYNTFGMDEEQKLVYDIEKTNNAYIESLKAVGLESITGAEYIDRYAYAIENGLSEEQIKNWDNLGESMENATNAMEAYKDSLDSTIVDIKSTMESLLREELDRLNNEYDTQSSLVSSLYTSSESYATPTTIYSADIYSAIGTESADDVTAMIDTWASQQIDYYTEIVDLQNEAEQDRVDALNAEIDLSNELRKSVISMQDATTDTWEKVRGIGVEAQKDNLTDALNAKEYEKVSSLFSTFATTKMDTAGYFGETDALVEIAKMNQQIQAVDAPQEQDRVEANLIEIGEYTDSINANTLAMYDTLIKTEEKKLPEIKDGITALIDKNIEYFDKDSDFGKFMLGMEPTYEEKMIEQKELLLEADQNRLDFYAISDKNQQLNTLMLDRQFTATGISVNNNATDIASLRNEIASLKALQAESNAIALLQLEAQQESASNTAESGITA